MKLTTKTQLRTSSSLLALSLAFFVFTSSDAWSMFRDALQNRGLSEEVIEAQVQRAKKGATGAEIAESGAAANAIKVNTPPTWTPEETGAVSSALAAAKVDVAGLTAQDLEATQALTGAGVSLTREVITTTTALTAALGNTATAITWVKGVQGMDFTDAGQVAALNAIAGAAWAAAPDAADVKAYEAMIAAATGGTVISAGGNPTENECRAYVAAQKAGTAPATQADLAALVAYHGVKGKFANTADELTQINNLVGWGAAITADILNDYGVMSKAGVPLDQTTWDVVAQARNQLGAAPTEADVTAALAVVGATAAVPAINATTLTADQINAAKALQTGGVNFTTQDQVRAAVAIHVANNAITADRLTLDQLNLYVAAPVAAARACMAAGFANAPINQGDIQEALNAAQAAGIDLKTLTPNEITLWVDPDNMTALTAYGSSPATPANAFVASQNTYNTNTVGTNANNATQAELDQARQDLIADIRAGRRF